MIVPLQALEPSRGHYLAMLCQPHGTVHATNQGIGNSDSGANAPMYVEFLQRATNALADLVVTPEYCVPWSVFEEVTKGRILPPLGTLWH